MWKVSSCVQVQTRSDCNRYCDCIMFANYVALCHCPQPKEHDNDSSAVLYFLADFDGISYGKEYLTFLKGDTIVNLLKPGGIHAEGGGIDAEGWTDGQVDETSGAGSISESPIIGACKGTDFLLSEHELAQERLYRLWRAGWVQGENVLLWAQSIERLSLEGDCDYLIWLLQRFPRLWENEEHTTSEGSVREVGGARTTERWFPPGYAA